MSQVIPEEIEEQLDTAETFYSKTHIPHFFDALDLQLSIAPESNRDASEILNDLRLEPQLLQEIDDILISLYKQIEDAGEFNFYPAAKKEADRLRSSLNLARNQLANDLNHSPVQAKLNFFNLCKLAIARARPVLEKDLSWGTYLLNLLKELANLLAKVLHVNPKHFFTLAQSNSMKAVNTAQGALQQSLYIGFFRKDREKPEDKIPLENALAKAMLEECLTNQEIKKTLQALADVLSEQILQPVIDAVSSASNFNQIEPQALREAIQLLAQAHSAEGRQYGGLLKESYKTAKEILDDIHNVKALLQALKLRMSDTEHSLQSLDDAAQLIKVMVDLGYGFIEKLQYHYVQQPEEQARLAAIKGLIWPSPEELNVRISRLEVEKKAKLATKLGIGRDDLVLAADPEEGLRYYAGKAVFMSVDIETRLCLTAEAFDKLYQDLQLAERNSDPESLEKARQVMETFKAKQKDNFGSAWLQFFLDRQDLPGGVTEAIQALKDQEPIAYKKWVTSFEPASIKLARRTKEPLIASISGSTARPIITLEYFNAFNKPDGSYDFDKLQIFSNCVVALFGRGGHHCLCEGGLVYDAAIDRVAIFEPERLPATLQADLKARQAASNTEVYAERLLPYYCPGDDASFFHHSYREQVMARAVVEEESELRYTP